MRTRPAIALLLTLFLAGSAIGEGEFDDHVSTLSLSQELDSRGSLGGVTVDQLGFLYVANFRDKVWRISPEGEVVELARGLDAMVSAYERYSNDPVRGQEDTVAEMVAYGYRHLSGGQFAEAMRIFGLNAEANPDSAAAQYQLGKANRYLGNTDVAIAQYRKALALDPAHPQAPGRLAQLGAD